MILSKIEVITILTLFNQSHQKTALLTYCRDLILTSDLTSGDKTLSFSYPLSAPFAGELMEECYLQTQTDEFVLKGRNQTGDWISCEAALNVEELEGKPFPYGFETVERTLTDCLTLAFQQTGWKVGSCTITKKRTIRQENACSAWDILRDCLKTYRAEPVIDSISKTVHLYAQIGSDKGCYFMEDLNLRRIGADSDSYDFCTRLIPQGKDGLRLWVNGKDYLENYQYSQKVKTLTWVDERYTNTTSLLEDGTAKLEELSKPRRSYTADVVDLAAVSPDYKNILDYGLGDVVTLLSKKNRIREKQRIVRMTQHPMNPEKNTVELSNVLPGFAQLQKQEQEMTKTEAILASNKRFKETLDNGYYTTEQVESKIAAMEDKIELSVTETVKTRCRTFTAQPVPPYQPGDLWMKESGVILVCGAEKTAGQAFSPSDWRIASDQSKALEALERVKEAEAKIEVAKEEIQLSVSETIKTRCRTFTAQPLPPYQPGDLWVKESGLILVCSREKAQGQAFSQSDWQVAADQAKAQEAIDRVQKAETAIALTKNDIELRAKKNELIGLINVSPERIKIAAKNLDLSGCATFSDLSTPGRTVINGANITTGTISANRISGGTIDGNSITVKNLRAENISYGTLSGDRVSGGTIWGSVLADGELRGSSITQNLDGSGCGVRIQNGVVTFYSSGWSNGEIYAANGGHFAINAIKSSGLSGSGELGLETRGSPHFIMRENGKINVTSLYAEYNLVCTGYKNALHKTEHFGGRLINAYETAEYYFGDIGEGVVADGSCRVEIDPIFLECINTSVPYQVFLTPYGDGRVYVAERAETYFLIKGDNIPFAWELKAKRRGYEDTRLEQPFEGTVSPARLMPRSRAAVPPGFTYQEPQWNDTATEEDKRFHYNTRLAEFVTREERRKPHPDIKGALAQYGLYLEKEDES